MQILDVLKNNQEQLEIKENNIKCDENLEVKKSPMYYLKLQEKYNRNKVNTQKKDQIAENITQNILSNYRSVFFCFIKYILSNGNYNKQELLNEFNTMYQKEKLEKVKVNSKIYELQIKKFLDIEEARRKEIIEEASSQIQKVEWKYEEDTQEYVGEIIDKETYEIIQNIEDIYIEWKYTPNRTRIMYLYKEGLVLAFDIKNEYIESNSIKIKKEKFNFIEKFIAKGIEKQESNDKNNIIMINNQVFNYDTSLFYIVLLLSTEQKKLDEKLFFQYEQYFSELEHRMMENEEKKNRYLFVNWYPNKNESENIIKMCSSIIRNIEFDFQRLNLFNLKYYAQYYYKKKMYNKAILFYERMAQFGVDLAYYEISRIYKEQKEYQLARQYAEKCIRFISIYKKLTEKECCKIIIDDKNVPDITDSKMYGEPYLPLGERYPVTKDGKPLNLIIQINLKDINLQGFPSQGMIEVFADANSRKPEYEIRYYEDVVLEYQTSFPKVEIPKYSIIDKINMKINFEKEYTYMPIVNPNCKSMIKKTIELYNNYIGEKIYNYNNELDCDMIYDLISEIDLSPLIIGGYADYANTDYYASSQKESVIKLMNDTGGDECSINVLITKKDLEDKRFEKAILFFED